MSAMPDIEDLGRVLGELTHPELPSEPDTLAQLATVGLTLNAWRNTHLENLHAGDHPSGGFEDSDMLRFNVATTRLVATHLLTEPTDWPRLAAAVHDPERVLPGGITVGELAGDEHERLAEDVDRAVWTFAQVEARQGRSYAHTMLAMVAMQMGGRDWYGTPWWPELIEVFMGWLEDPDSEAWEYGDVSSSEPASVADRGALRKTLLDEPEALDDDGIYWCLRHGLGQAANAGIERWRARRLDGNA